MALTAVASALSVCSAGCRPEPVPAGARLAAIVPPLAGRIEPFAVPVSDRVRAAQAVMTDVADGATVSLIETVSGRTAAYGRCSATAIATARDAPPGRVVGGGTDAVRPSGPNRGHPNAI